jgi:1,4-dihydroxy-6-naphthoate synthase
MRYDTIEDFVLSGNGPGVIIHENRFTYKEKGLVKIADLGDFWETTTGNPIPLGGIVIKRGINNTIATTIDRLINKSIAFAFSNYPVLNDYIRMHAREMSEEVMRKHIDLYVNDYSLDLGDQGKEAIITFMKGHKNFDSQKTAEQIFLHQ